MMSTEIRGQPVKLPVEDTDALFSPYREADGTILMSWRVLRFIDKCPAGSIATPMRQGIVIQYPGADMKQVLLLWDGRTEPVYHMEAGTP
jgi:hypothetical protein